MSTSSSIKIYSSKGNVLLSVIPDDNSYRTRTIMGENDLVLYFSLAEHVELPLGANCIFEGETYTLMQPSQVKMEHKRRYEYTVTLSGSYATTKTRKFRNPVDGRLKFPLTAKPKEHLQMFIDNMNRYEKTNKWTIGECIDDVEKLVSYDHDYCWDALAKIANEYETEFEIKGTQVSLHKVEYNKANPLELAYGKGNGFKPGVGRSNASDTPPVEVLYVQGGERNIDRSKYPPRSDAKRRAASNGCLMLPGLCYSDSSGDHFEGGTIGYDGDHFEGEEGYDADNARHYIVGDYGLSIHNSDRWNLNAKVEDSIDRSDDYPKRVGTISKVIEVDKSKNLYYFTDTEIPSTLNYENYLIGEEEMTVIFQTGKLAGREFDVKYIHLPKKVNGVVKDGRRFEIVPQEIDGVMMPGDSFVPEEGDTYAVFHVMLPEAYISNYSDKSGAEWDMFRSAVKYLYEHEDRKFSFTGELDGLWAKQDWTNRGGAIILGGYIRFTDTNLAPNGVLVRITAIKENLNNPHSPKITLSNETISGSVAGTIKQLESKEVEIEEERRNTLQFTKRRFRDAKETISMLQEAMLYNFSNPVNPISVETMSLLAGDESMQYRFVTQAGSTTPVQHNITWLKDTKQLKADAGTIQHLTIGIDSIRSSHAASEYRYWSVSQYTSARLSDPDAKYYLYIKATKQSSKSTTGDPASFMLESSPHNLEEGDYYWLLCGILNSESNGERSFVTLYGFTEILPGRITTGKIISDDGKTWFDLEGGEIHGNIRFTNDMSIDDVIDAYNATIIEGGKIKTDLIDADSLTARKLEVIDDNGAGVKIVPDGANKKGTVTIHDKHGNVVSIFEGTDYPSMQKLFSDSFGEISIAPASGTDSARATDTTDGAKKTEKQISDKWHTKTPCEVIIGAGHIHCYAKAEGYTSSGGTSGITGVEKISRASASCFLEVRTYIDENCTQHISTNIIAMCSATASAGMASGSGTLVPGKEDSETIDCISRSAKVPSGYHKLFLRYELKSSRLNSTATVKWGSSVTQGDGLMASFYCNYYVSRYFANGFCLGLRSDNYVMAWRSSEGTGTFMNFAVETGGVGFKVTPDGITYRPSATSQWKTLT